MDYISSKISGFLPSSSPPAASTRKRKAGTLSDTDDPPPTRIERVSASMFQLSANKAIHKPRAVTSRVVYPEQDIQEQLLQEFREEDVGRGLLKKQLLSRKAPSVDQRPRTQKIWEIVKAPKTLSAGQRPRTQKLSEILKAPKTYPAARSSASLVPNSSPSTSRLKTIRPTLTSATRWSKQPNSHARTLLAAHGNNTKAFLRSLEEPLYAVRDAEIRDALWEMTSQIQDFANQHFSFQVTDEAQLRAVLPTIPKETVKIIGVVASGGPDGAKGWEELFLDSQKRQALVCAIVGNVLVEQVLKHLFFGGSKVQLEQMGRVQDLLKHEDGFDRTTTFANKIRTLLSGSAPTEINESSLHQPKPSSFLLPRNFNAHITRITASLLTHLSPILSLSTAPFSTEALIPALHALVTHTALLSLCMRLDASTAYIFHDVYKETPFVRREMDYFNEDEMNATHPRFSEKDGLSPAEIERRAAMSDRERKQMRSEHPIVQVTILPRCVAYRRGGWEDTPSSKTGARKDKAKGVRVRPLTDAWVSCRWGVERRLKKGKSLDVPATHGSRWGGGFVEFYPGVEGVVDPYDRENNGRVRDEDLVEGGVLVCGGG